MKNLTNLRKIAEAEETQKWGTWAVEEGDDFDGFCVYIKDGGHFGRSYLARDMHQGESEGKSTAKFIATFDPPTVLSLITRLEQAEQAVARVREALSSHPRTCDRHTVNDPVKCGWQRAVIDVQDALDGEQS